jgi:predicted nucleic acid-binding protein
MIFLDTSAIYALADSRDPNHQGAVERMRAIISRGEPLLTHNYVLLESISLLQARLGFSAGSRFARDSSAFVVDWVTHDLHAAAEREWSRSGKRHVSLVDHVSFLIMNRRKVDTAFAFDPDFKSYGLRLFDA